MDRIAAESGLSRATVVRSLARYALNRWCDLKPAEPVRRLERAAPGELLRIDIEKLGRFTRIGHRITKDRTGESSRRGVGWEFVHVCIDYQSRLAFNGGLDSERKEDSVAILRAAVA